MGKTIKGDAEAQALAAYLYSSRLSHMSGIYMLPLDYASSDLGWDTTRAMRVLIECGHCEYDDVTDTVFIRDFARLQIAPMMVRADNRHRGLCRYLEDMGDSKLVESFKLEYGDAYDLGPEPKPLASPFEGAPKPVISDQGSEIHITSAKVIDFDLQRIERVEEAAILGPQDIERMVPHGWGSASSLKARQVSLFARMSLTGDQFKRAVSKTLEEASRPCLAYFITTANGVVEDDAREKKDRASGTPLNFKRPKIEKNTEDEPRTPEDIAEGARIMAEIRAEMKNG